jgi:hypothetical protein
MEVGRYIVYDKVLGSISIPDSHLYKLELFGYISYEGGTSFIKDFRKSH